MKVIYEPTGKAREYAELACNLFHGCTHGCKYCYAPGATRTKREDFHRTVSVRDNILEKLEDDLKTMATVNDEREILFCFTSDPFPSGVDTFVAYDALSLVEKYGRKATVLTKNPGAVVQWLRRHRGNNIRLGITVTGLNYDHSRKWEPNAPSNPIRIFLASLAVKYGIPVWVSIEPVIDPCEALQAFIELQNRGVTNFKIGKINHNKELENAVHWTPFVTAILYEARPETNILLKQSLLPYVPKLAKPLQYCLTGPGDCTPNCKDYDQCPHRRLAESITDTDPR